MSGTVGTRIAATTGYSTALPGGIHFARGPDVPADYPYGVYTIEPGPMKATFEGHYFQTFTVSVAAFCPVGDASTDVHAVEKFLLRALAGDEAETAFRAASLRNSGEQYVGSQIVQPEGEYVEPLASARDVFAAGVTMEVTALGVRSAA